MKYNEYLNNFVDVINKNVDVDDLNNLKNNLSNLRIRSKFFISNMFSFVEVSGEYNSKKNLISLFRVDESVIYHELLHMASSKWQNNHGYEGFFDNSFGPAEIEFGYGINEGYTELLARRFFDIDSDVCNGYEYQVGIVNMLEKIIGKDNMIRYYFNANLPGLIDDLSAYSNIDNVLLFIIKTDYILKELDKRSTYYRRRIVCQILSEINEFLSTTYIKKMYLMYKQNQISYDNMLISLVGFNSLLVDEPKEDEYIITSKDDIYNYMQDTFEINDKQIIEDYKRIKIL